MNDDRVVTVLARVRRQARGAPVSVVHVCDATPAGLGVDGAAATVMVSSTVVDTVHATDRVAAELEEWQLVFGQGPRVDAFSAGGPVLAADLGSPDWLARWPVFTPAAMASGARAVFALPLQIGAIRLGTLDLYRTGPGPLSRQGLADALAFADIAGTLLLDAAAGIPPGTAEGTWQRDDPTAHQAEVHQATGMILVQLGTSAEAAFARLRAYAYAQDRRLGDVARDVVERRLRFGSDSPSERHDEGVILPDEGSDRE
jgi:hypothetical protein